MKTDASASQESPLPAERAGRSARRELVDAAFHLVALCSFAFAQPLLEVLRHGATFFVARRSATVDLWVLALGLTLVPALALFAIELALAPLGARSRRAAHFVFVALLCALILLPLLERLESDSAWVVAPALVLGLGCAAAYARWAPARSLLSLLSLAPLVFAGLFLASPEIRHVLAGDDATVLPKLDASGAPSAVVVVLDELPLSSLVTGELAIDANLFPNFARLAATSTWFQNATASHESTEYALPAIMTGELPDDPNTLPTAADHPRSIFSMLAGAYRMRTWETFTSVCPSEIDDRGSANAARRDEGMSERIQSLARDVTVVYAHVVAPQSLRGRLPSIEANWGDFGGGAQPSNGETPAPGGGDIDLAAKEAAGRTDRVGLFREFVASIDGDKARTLYFLHVLLPHGPWILLPSGKSYDPTGLPSDFPGAHWPNSEAITTLALKRHLLQLGAVDRLLGELLDRLEARALFDDCAFLLVADHGIHFEPDDYARQVFKKNAWDIAHVPFFAKRPHQREAAIEQRSVQTVDVLPTLLDMLELRAPWELDGHSAFDPATGSVKKQVFRKLHPPLALETLAGNAWPGLQRKLALLGEHPSWSDVYAAGPRLYLVGRPLVDLAPTSTERIRFGIDRAQVFEHIDLAAPLVPAHVAGWIESSDGAVLPDTVAIAINGVIRVVVSTFARTDERARFAAMIPENAWRAGENWIEILAAGPNAALVRLPPSGSSGTRAR